MKWGWRLAEYHVRFAKCLVQYGIKSSHCIAPDTLVLSKFFAGRTKNTDILF